MKTKKDYGYDKMSYKHDDKKYGYEDSYKPNIKYIKCGDNFNINGFPVRPSTSEVA